MENHKLLFIDLGEIAKDSENSFFCPAEVTNLIRKLNWLLPEEYVTTIRCVKASIVMLDAIRLTDGIEKSFGNRFKAGGAYSADLNYLELRKIINHEKQNSASSNAYIIFTENKEMVVEFARHELIYAQIMSPITERLSIMVLDYGFHTFNII